MLTTIGGKNIRQGIGFSVALLLFCACLSGCASTASETTPTEQPSAAQATTAPQTQPNKADNQAATAATKSPAPNTASDSQALPTINDIHFALPANEKWQQSKNQRAKGNIVAEWVVKGHSSLTTPMMVAYQRLTQRQAPQVLLKQLVMPYQQQCADMQITVLTLPSRYPVHHGLEIVCSHFKGRNHGLVIESAIFSDTKANHLLLAEVKTPASAKAGQLTFANKKEKHLVELSQQRFQAIKAMMHSIQVCDVQQRCY